MNIYSDTPKTDWLTKLSTKNTKDQMDKDNFNWIRLRFTISLLGEYHNWWSTKVLTGNGEAFLEYVLPKTKNFAAHQLATEISRLEHDKNIGPGRYHIFRLPQKWEEQIFNDLKSQAPQLSILPAMEMLIELLKMSSSISVSAAKGPLLIGAHDELNDISVFQSIAKHYHEAFTNNYKTYPYLS
jgi:hypothetical protein